MSKLFIPNFIIYATLPTIEATCGDYEVDPETGNPIAVNTTLEIKAWMQGYDQLRQGRTTAKPEHPSVDFNTVYLSGYAVTPKAIPARTLLAREKYNAKYIEPITGTEQQGTFVLAPQVNEQRPRVAKALAKRLGMELQGTFEFGYGS
jgi:hypothetical protein